MPLYRVRLRQCVWTAAPGNKTVIILPLKQNCATLKGEKLLFKQTGNSYSLGCGTE